MAPHPRGYDQDRSECDFQDYARSKVDAFMAEAGLTQQEHDVYWERVGYLRSWRQIGRLLRIVDAPGRDASTATVERRHRSAHRKLVNLVVSQNMKTSPLHPEYTYHRAKRIIAEVLAAEA